MKKMLKKWCSLILVLTMITCGLPVYAGDYMSKLNEELKKKLLIMDETEKIPIVLSGGFENISFLPQEELEQKLIEIMGEENYWLARSGNTECLNQLMDLEFQFKKEAYKAFCGELARELGVEDAEDLKMWGAELYFSTTKSEILRLAEHERVTFIWWLGTVGEPLEEPVCTALENGVVEVYTGTSYIYKYTAESALHILNACAGIEIGHFNRVYDVNADGSVNTEDALWALESAANVRVVEFSLDHVFPE